MQQRRFRKTGDMLNYLRGPRPMSPMDVQFMDDRFRGDGKKIPFSYFEGANPGNNYKPTEPMSIQIRNRPIPSIPTAMLGSTSAAAARIARGKSSSARKKAAANGSFWEQQVMVGIKPAKEDDPWA